MKEVLSPHRFRVGPSLPPGRFRAVDTRWVPWVIGLGAYLLLAGVLLLIGGVGGYLRKSDPEMSLLGAYIGGGLSLIGAMLAVWGWLRHRAAKQELPLREPPSVIHARWAERSRL